MRNSLSREPDPVNLLRRIPFVRDLQYNPLHSGEIQIRTPTGRFRLLVETKQSFFTLSTVNQLVPWLKHVSAGKPSRIILLARHIPRTIAERLIEAKVNFADEAGNVHLELGDRYNWTVVGKTAAKPASERRPISAAQIQLLFQFAADPDSVTWPVRRLEAAAGISKSKAAQARHELIAAGLVERRGRRYQLGPAKLLSEHLVFGYAQVLRPKLLLGTYRPVERTTESFLARLRQVPPSGVRYSLSGAPAADLLQHFYRGQELPIFVDPSSRRTAQALRLLPDSKGPVSLLRAFGELVFWQEREHHMLAPPWLIYAELLAGSDPRAHEAAAEFHDQFLK
jgi:hypothetical protein